MYVEIPTSTQDSKNNSSDVNVYEFCWKQWWLYSLTAAGRKDLNKRFFVQARCSSSPVLKRLNISGSVLFSRFDLD